MNGLEWLALAIGFYALLLALVILAAEVVSWLKG